MLSIFAVVFVEQFVAVVLPFFGVGGVAYGIERLPWPMNNTGSFMMVSPKSGVSLMVGAGGRLSYSLHINLCNKILVDYGSILI